MYNHINRLHSDVCQKRCSCCGEMKPLSEFSVDRKMGDGFSNTCRRCRQLRYREQRPLSVQLSRFTDEDLQEEMARRAAERDMAEE